MAPKESKAAKEATKMTAVQTDDYLEKEELVLAAAQTVADALLG